MNDNNDFSLPQGISSVTTPSKFSRKSAKGLPSYISPMARSLTATEHQMYNELTEGFSEDVIAKRNKLSLKTVKFHKTNIYKKLKVGKISELIARELAYYKNKCKELQAETDAKKPNE